MEKPEHVAKRYQDQYYCSRCGKSWDIDDPEPPECEDESNEISY